MAKKQKGLFDEWDDIEIIPWRWCVGYMILAALIGLAFTTFVFDLWP